MIPDASVIYSQPHVGSGLPEGAPKGDRGIPGDLPIRGVEPYLERGLAVVIMMVGVQSKEPSIR